MVVAKTLVGGLYDNDDNNDDNNGDNNDDNDDNDDDKDIDRSIIMTKRKMTTMVTINTVGGGGDLNGDAGDYNDYIYNDDAGAYNDYTYI